MNQKQKRILGLIIIVVVIIITFAYTKKEKFFPLGYRGDIYPESCEFQKDCLWDTARWVQLSNGMEGVCTLHGIACPAFSKDHYRAMRDRYTDGNIDLIDDNYAAALRRSSIMNGGMVKHYD